MLVSIVAALGFAASALGQYDQWYFSSNASNYQCSKLAFSCVPPKVCTHNSLTDKTYCCEPGSPENVCWSTAPLCTGGSSTTPGSGQINCGSFCCLGGKEQCTQRYGQANICWATAENPVANSTTAAMNATYSSLAAASPQALALTVSLAQIIPVSSTSTPSSTPSSTPVTTPPATSTAMSSPTTTTASSSATSSSTTAPSQTNGPSSGPSISTGAIAGIVVGGLAALGVLIGAALYFGQRKRHAYAQAGAPFGSNSGPPYYGHDMQHGAQEAYGKPMTSYYGDSKYAHYTSQQHVEPSEMYAGAPGPIELPAKYERPS